MQSGGFELFYYNDTTLKSVDVHEHDYCEFHFLLEDDMEYHIGDRSYQPEYGDCLLTPPDIPHYPRLHSYGKSYHRFVSWLNQDYHKKLWQTDEELAYCFDYARSHQTYRFHTGTITTQETQGKLTDLMEELAGGRSFHRLISELIVASFPVYVNRLPYGSLRQKSAVYENILYLNICNYINRHLEEGLSLDSPPSFFYVSKYHISYTFEDSTGISFRRYTLKKRLHASENTTLSDHPINHVYLQYGFKDYINLFKASKKGYGVSPKEYREQHYLPKQQDHTVQRI